MGAMHNWPWLIPMCLPILRQNKAPDNPVGQEQKMTKSTNKRGFLRSAMDGLIAARQREANRYVARAQAVRWNRNEG